MSSANARTCPASSADNQATPIIVDNDTQASLVTPVATAAVATTVALNGASSAGMFSEYPGDIATRLQARIAARASTLCASGSLIKHENVAPGIEKLEAHASAHAKSALQLANLGIDAAIDTALVSTLLSEEHLMELDIELRGEHADATSCALLALREAILDHGAASQLQVAQSTLFPLVLGLCRTSTDVRVQDSACRVLSALAAKNDATSRIVAESGIVDRVYEFVRRGEAHLADTCSMYVAVATDAGHCGCGILKCASGAMWALCALCKSPAFQVSLANTADVVTAVISHLRGVSDEAQASASWLISSAVLEAPSLVSLWMERGLVGPLLHVILNAVPSGKALACWALRSLAMNNSDAKAMFNANNAVSALGNVIQHTSGCVFELETSLWALGTLAMGNKVVQDRVRTDGVLALVVEALTSTDARVHNQAAAALYNVCAHNGDNQVLVADLGGIEKLVVLLPTTQGTVKSVEKVLAALLCLSVKQPSNQLRISMLPGCLSSVVRFISSSSSRIQGLAAGLVRTLAAEQPLLQTLLTGHGAFPRLLSLAASKDKFAQEQAVAAMYNLVSNNSNTKSILAAFNVTEPLFAILTDASKPSKLAYTCSIMILSVLCEGNAVFSASVCACLPVLASLLRFCHPSCSCPRLRGQADRLLRTIAPEAHAGRVVGCCVSMLDALVSFKAPAPGSVAKPTDRDAAFCTVCHETDGTAMVMLPCWHAFHVQCIMPWFAKGRDTCPNCKASVITAVNGTTGGDSFASADACPYA
jgi:hypothetical protein